MKERDLCTHRLLTTFEFLLNFRSHAEIARMVELVSAPRIEAWNSFSRLFDLFFVASKTIISFITICDRISSCAGIVLCFSPSQILCFDFKWLVKQSVFEPPPFVQRSTKCTLVLVEPCCVRNSSKLLIFFDY